jgi:hypothetical protein
MRKIWLLLLLLVASAAAQVPVSITSAPLTASGTFVVANPGAFTSAMFSETPSGSPTSVSVTVQGCMQGATLTTNCDAAASTNTSTSTVNLNVNFSKIYDYFLVTVGTLSGGTSPTMTIQARPGWTPTSGSGSNVSVTSPVDGSGYVEVNCKTGCSSGNANGQATMANSAPVVIASNQSTINVAGTGTAGTPGTAVLTVQGVSGGQTVPTNDNVATFGGTNVQTGTGASGAGVPRVTVSNDSSLAANQSVNVNQIAGTAATQKAASTQSAATDTSLVVQINPNQPNLTTALNVALAANQSVNTAQVNGSAVSTAATGVQKVGVVGNAGVALDATVAAGTAPTNGLAVLGQYSTTAPAPSGAQTLVEQLDQQGNQLGFPGIQFKTGAGWTSATTLNTLQYPTGTTSVGQANGAPAYLVQLDQTTTITGGAVTFQGTYDGTNWVTIPVAQVLNPQTLAQLTNPYTLVASTNTPFLIVSNGFTNIRANLTTVISGTATVTPYWATLPYGPFGNNNLAQIAGGTVVTAATGVQKVGVVGNTGATLDAANGSTLPTNTLSVGGTSQSSGSNGTVGTSGKLARPLTDDTGQFYVIPGGSYRFSAFIQMTTNTTTQIEAAPAASTFAFVTGVYYITTVAGTSTTVQLEYGTGTNCATSPVAMMPAVPNTAVGNVAFMFGTPLVPAAANAICAVQAGTTAGTTSVLITGYIAP